MSDSIQGNGVEQQQSEALIPGLPEDLAMLCIVRVPRRDHATLRCVSRGWNSFVGSNRFLDLRKSMGLAEAWLYALSRDSSKCLRLHAMDPQARKWLRLPAMPEASGLERYGTSCSVLGRRLFIVGGCNKHEYPTNEVLCYDAAANAWFTAPPLQVARCHFVTASLGDKLYAIGGMGPTAGALNSWEVLGGDRADRWKLHDDDPNVVSDLGEALVVGRRIYVRHASPIPPAHGAPYAAVLDTGSGDRTWQSLDDELSRQWCGPAVQVGGEVYMLDQNQGIKLMVMENVEAGEWSAVGRLSPRSIRTPCKIAAIGRELFVVGRGLQTMLLNLDKASRARGLLVTSSIEGLPPESSHDIVVSCNVLEL